MKFGMTPDQFELLNRLVIGPLKSSGAEVFIFGSRVTGVHHPHSDVDILYRMPPGTSLQSRLLSEIRESIEESSFPYSIDLVAEEDLAEGYRANVLRHARRVN